MTKRTSRRQCRTSNTALTVVPSPKSIADLKVLAREIKGHHQKLKTSCRTAVKLAVEVGKKLIKAKGLCRHGEWLQWLEANCGLSIRQSDRYMQLAREIPNLSAEWSCAGTSITKALALLGQDSKTKSSKRRAGKKRATSGRETNDAQGDEQADVDDYAEHDDDQDDEAGNHEGADDTADDDAEADYDGDEEQDMENDSDLSPEIVEHHRRRRRLHQLITDEQPTEADRLLRLEADCTVSELLPKLLRAALRHGQTVVEELDDNSCDAVLAAMLVVHLLKAELDPVGHFLPSAVAALEVS